MTVSETMMSLTFYAAKNGPGAVPLKSETLWLLSGDLSAGGQVPACRWTVVMLSHANDTHGKEPKSHRITTLNVSLAV